MRTSRLFHAIVVVGTALTADAAVGTAAVALPLAGCETEDGFGIIDMPNAPPVDLRGFTPDIIEALGCDLQGWGCIAADIGIQPDLWMPDGGTHD